MIYFYFSCFSCPHSLCRTPATELFFNLNFLRISCIDKICIPFYPPSPIFNISHVFPHSHKFMSSYNSYCFTHINIYICILHYAILYHIVWLFLEKMILHLSIAIDFLRGRALCNFLHPTGMSNATAVYMSTSRYHNVQGSRVHILLSYLEDTISQLVLWLLTVFLPSLPWHFHVDLGVGL